MKYKTELHNETSGRIHIYLNLYGTDKVTLPPNFWGWIESRNEPTAIFAPYSKVYYKEVLKKGETVIEVVTKKRSKYRHPAKGKPFVTTFLNNSEIDTQLFGRALGQTFYIPRGIEITVEMNPMDPEAVYERVEWTKPKQTGRTRTVIDNWGIPRQTPIFQELFKHKRPQKELDKLFEVRQHNDYKFADLMADKQRERIGV